MGGSSPSSRDQRETLLRCIASVAVIAAALAVLLIPMARSAPEQLLADAIHAFNEGDYSTAGQLTSRILEQDASSDAARLIVGLSAEKLYQAEREAELLKPLATDGTGSYESLLAAYAVGKRWLKLGHLGQAEQCFEYVIQHWPEHPGVNREYAYLMQIQGRTFESLNPVLQRVRQGIFGSTELHVLGSSEKRFIRGDDEIQRCRENCPDDCRILMPQARRAFLSNDADTAESLYTSILQQAPSLVQPHVDLGRILVNAGRCEEFLKLDQADAVREARHPGIWLNRALYAEQQSSLPAAIGCLRRALEIAPDHVEVNYLMSQFLSRDGQAELSQFFGQRARILAEIELIVPEFYDNPTMDHVRRMESGFRNTGRFWEAAAVAQFATRMNDGDPSWGTDALRRNATLLNAQGRDSLTAMISSEDRRLPASYSEDYRKLRSPPASGSLELAASAPTTCGQQKKHHRTTSQLHNSH